MSALRITGDIDRMRARARRKTIGRQGGRDPLGVPAASAERIRVSRTDIGGPAWRLTASAAELERHGAVNARFNTVTDPAGDGTRYRPAADRQWYVTTDRVDSLASERAAQPMCRRCNVTHS